MPNLRQEVPFFLFDLIHGNYESVTAFGYGFYIFPAVSSFAQNLPQQRDVFRDIRFLNERVGPEPPHQFIFVNQVPGVLYQDQKGFESFLSQWHWSSVKKQEALFRIEAKGPKGVQVLWVLTHRVKVRFVQNFFATSERLPNRGYLTSGTSPGPASLNPLPGILV